MLPKFNFKKVLNEVTATRPNILPQAPKPLNDPPAETVEPGLTHWMRPPQGQNMDDGTQMGEEGYIDPHAGAMEEWLDIDKGPTGGFRPDGTAILHSDPDSAHSLSLLSGDSDSGSGEGGYGKKRVGEQSRKQMNKTGSRTSSLLTGRG